MPLHSHLPEPEARPNISMESINNTPIFGSLSHPPAPHSRAESPPSSNSNSSSRTPSPQPAAELTSDYTSQPTEETPLLITAPAPEIQGRDDDQEHNYKPFLDRPLWRRAYGDMTRRHFLRNYLGELIWLLFCWMMLRAIGEVTGARAWGCAKKGIWRMVVKTIFGWPWENGGKCGAWCEGKC